MYPRTPTWGAVAGGVPIGSGAEKLLGRIEGRSSLGVPIHDQLSDRDLLACLIDTTLLGEEDRIFGTREREKLPALEHLKERALEIGWRRAVEAQGARVLERDERVAGVDRDGALDGAQVGLGSRYGRVRRGGPTPVQ